MRCAFCQNGDISRDKDNGQLVNPRTLARMALQLRLTGAHNINWVGGEPTIHLHSILHAIRLLAHTELKHQHAAFRGFFNVPMLFNSNFFFSQKARRLLLTVIDIWLPDFKFGPGRCAVRIARTPWYWETVTDNLKYLCDRGENMVVRILIMPNHVDCCIIPILNWIKENTPNLPVNLMDQYHPDCYCNPHSPDYNPKYAELARFPTKNELKRAYEHAEALGLDYYHLSFEKYRWL